MTNRDFRVWVRKQFPHLSRKEYRTLLSKGEIEIRETVARKQAELERHRVLANENYKREQERYAREHEDPLIKLMRVILEPKEVKAQELKRVDGCVIA